MKIFVLSALAIATYVSATCDDDVVAANTANLTQACTSDIQGGTPPTIESVLSDWASNSHSIYQFGICGSTNCLDQFYALQSSYPSCSVSSATTYHTAIQNLNTSCANVTSTVAGYNGTCTVAAYADIYWARHVATLSADCASALNSFSYTSSSNWYSVVQAVPLSAGNLSAAFCGSAACVNSTTDNKAWLPNCVSDTGDNLFTTTGNLLSYCHNVNNPTTTAAPTTAAPNTTAAPANTTAAPSNTTEAPSNTTAAPSNSTSAPNPTPASTTPAPASNSSNTTTTAAPATTTAAPATTTAAPATTTAAPATTTAAPATETPTPTPTKSSASTISGLFAVALVAAVLA